MEKKAKPSDKLRLPQVSARHFSVARSDTPGENGKTPPSSGIVIQIRMKAPADQPQGKLFTRKNTEFWLSASD